MVDHATGCSGEALPARRFQPAVPWVSLSGRRQVAVITVQAAAQRELRSDEVLVFDWHHVAICCAGAGETSLHAAPGKSIAGSSTYRLLPGDPVAPVYAHRQAYPHLVDRDVTIDARRLFGRRQFRSNLPSDFGLRASLGRLPAQPSSPTPAEVSDELRAAYRRPVR